MHGHLSESCFATRCDGTLRACTHAIMAKHADSENTTVKFKDHLINKATPPERKTFCTQLGKSPCCEIPGKRMRVSSYTPKHDLLISLPLPRVAAFPVWTTPVHMPLHFPRYAGWHFSISLAAQSIITCSSCCAAWFPCAATSLRIPPKCSRAIKAAT